MSRATATVAFQAIALKGNLLPASLLGKVARFEAPQQKEADYGLGRGERLRERLDAAWVLTQELWQEYTGLKQRVGQAIAGSHFSLRLLQEVLGWRGLQPCNGWCHGDARYPISHRAFGATVPLILEGMVENRLDEGSTSFGQDGRRRSPHSCLQECLNADDAASWGLLCSGERLRLLHDNSSLVKPAYLAVDLELLIEADLFDEFAVLWLLLQASRLQHPQDGSCVLDGWKQEAEDSGERVLGELRGGVQQALQVLGCGFLNHPANGALHEALGSGSLSRQQFHEQLLRLVYRFLFLFTAEDRDLLFPRSMERRDPRRRIYREGYSIHRLRELAIRRSAMEGDYGDLWDLQRLVFSQLSHGDSPLGLPGLGGLFALDQCPHLQACELWNRAMLRAIRAISWFEVERSLTRVNYRDLNTEELGSVYEGLLDLHPQVTQKGGQWQLSYGGGAGSDRKTTGSYYTPDLLVQELIRSTLVPVIDDRLGKAVTEEQKERALLAIKVIDPACGSGHFLLAAARRLAVALAQVRARDDQPSEASRQDALRDVVSHCIYAVDKNPMAVELCKVALWIEALEPGKPLSFLDARIRCGDSLIGVFDYGMLRDGLPDDAFEPLSGDDKAVAKAYRAINRQQRETGAAPGLFKELSAPASINDGAADLLSMPEDTLQDIEAKSSAWSRLVSGPTWRMLKTACDMYVAAFLLPKTGEPPADPGLSGHLPRPTTETIWRSVRGGDVQAGLQATCIEAAEVNRAFHWPLEFPAVMAAGGFDAVIGNPPWERIKLQEQEFFATRDVEIATAPNKSERSKLIKKLKKAEQGTPQSRLSASFQSAKRASEAASIFVRKSGRFPLTGKGDVNTYALFAEHFSRLARVQTQSAKTAEIVARTIADTDGVHPPPGRAGVIVPTGIATDSSTSNFFGDLIARNRLSALYDFENRDRLFSDVHRSYKFSILTIGPSSKAHFAAFLLNTQALEEKDRQIELETGDFKLMNPNTLTAPLFRARADRDLTRKLYRAAPVLIRERPDHPDGDENPWGITFKTLFHMSEDSKHFRTAAQLSNQEFCREGQNWRHGDGRAYLPLYEAKMIHHFDHRFGSYAGLNHRPADGSLPETPDSVKANPNYEADPWYWVPEEETVLRLARVPSRLKQSFRKENAKGCLKVLAEWVFGMLEPGDLEPTNLTRTVLHAEARLCDVLGQRVLHRDIVGAKITSWLGKVAACARKMQRETPLSEDDLAFIKDAGALIKRKQPRWLMGWRDICRSTDERTVVASVFPRVGTGDTLLLKYQQQSSLAAAALNACFCSITLDYICRQKIGGTHLKYNVFKQNPVLAPEQFSPADLAFVLPRVLELTYTSHSMRPWAEDLGHCGPPFSFAPDRRPQLRAELDAFFARKYSLSRDELRYILDPTDTHGERYPSETFRGLKRNEIERYGEFRTRRLVLTAFDRLTGA
ncbi:MAG: type II DNA modification enzyme [Aphanocapsa feldmannii 277cI]|uniref:site-specific DNA-methyltransferase (adenine-specific) n=1 Tax=Aphanocapsa feldmannii 277cI TaxID=2507554 RepID=A0A524RST0_9CHRO|nr:MAG: type II DNA modification enzyme [Aphanocapsa feldmannii 277cI]